MNKISNAINITKKFLDKNSPAILTGLGISSMIASTVLAVKATPKALTLLSEAERKKELEDLNNENETVSDYKELTIKETVKTVWKEYIPAVSFGISGLILIWCGCHINNKRGTALATAYAVSERTLHDYRNKVIETIGERKEKEIREKINQDKIDQNPPKKETIILTSKNNTLMKDEWSGRYFKSDLDVIRKAINELNSDIVNFNYVSLNQYYDKIGIEHVKGGDSLGWNIEHGLINFDYDACMASNDEPCICISFRRAPSPDCCY